MCYRVPEEKWNPQKEGEVNPLHLLLALIMFVDFLWAFYTCLTSDILLMNIGAYLAMLVLSLIPVCVYLEHKESR
jgi:hypothetical protein